LTLLLFIAMTYPIFPVVGFAFTLAVLGFAQCEPGQTRMQAIYLLAMGFVQLTMIPWRFLVM
jgi:hypothetical protein